MFNSNGHTVWFNVWIHFILSDSSDITLILYFYSWNSELRGDRLDIKRRFDWQVPIRTRQSNWMGINFTKVALPSPQPIDSSQWWRHQMETFSALLAFCAGNSPVTGEFPTQRPVTRSFDDFFDVRLNQQLSKQWRPRWFETPSLSLWRHCNAYLLIQHATAWTKCLTF